MRRLLIVWAVLAIRTAICVHQPWLNYINSPSTRTVKPSRIHAISGDIVVTFAEDGAYVLRMAPGSQISLDFGYVGGLLSMKTETTVEKQQFSLAFSESPVFARAISDDTGAVYTQDYDQALNVTVPAGITRYTMPSERFRGGFKFVTLHAFEQVVISDLVCKLGYSPSQERPDDYAGYFYTDEDDLLVRTWYAGVFTAQTNIAPPNTSRWLPQVQHGWAYNASLGAHGPMILDGAKRDRAVWSGDLGIAGTTAFIGLGDIGLEAVYYALETMFLYQNKTDGMLPFSGPTTNSWLTGSRSEVYHAWVLVACHNYAIYTGNSTWLDAHWDQIASGVAYITRATNNSIGLAEQVNDNDWARIGGGGFNSALNALNYHALSSLGSLALDTSTRRNQRAELGNVWTKTAVRLKDSFNAILWDADVGLFRDNETEAGSQLFPQDGNSLSLFYNLTRSSIQAATISKALTRNWNEIGPVTPELPDTISPFITGIEVLGHYAAGNPSRALGLMRRTWGYMLNSPLMTGSTLVEGMSANGSLAYRSTRGYNYDSAYTSLSHSWSTGPTQALTFKAVGLEIAGWNRWVFRPLPGDLKSLRAGYQSPLGRFEAVVSVGNDFINADVVTPPGMKGSVTLPGSCKRATVNEQPYQHGHDIQGGTLRIHGSSCKFES
ncbi:alpha-L-rhamnosidase [Xylariaceae sp. FL1019]|nr:alpha-L-rhamnosidase [Xylariaceae sp. FL1019]